MILIRFSEAAILTFLFFSLYFLFFPLQVAPAVSSSTEAGHSGSDTAPPLHTCFLVNEGIFPHFFLSIYLLLSTNVLYHCYDVTLICSMEVFFFPSDGGNEFILP